MGIDFFKVGVYVFDSIDSSLCIIKKTDVLGKAAIMAGTTKTIVAIPTNVLNEGQIDY